MTVAFLGFALWRAGLRSALQYRTDTLIVIVMAIAFQGTGFAFLWVVLSRFESLAGWTLPELAFLYGLRLIAHALAGVLTGPFFGLEAQVRSGDFDRYLTRPIAPLLQFVTRRVEISIFGDLAGGVAIFAASNQLLDLTWSPASTAYLLLAIAGGALVESGVRILVGALTFRLRTSQALLFLVDGLFTSYGNYPLSIFGALLQFLLVVVLPVAFLAYLPSTVLLERGSGLPLAPLLGLAAPVVGVIWFAIAIRIFDRELGRYESAGS